METQDDASSHNVPKGDLPYVGAIKQNQTLNINLISQTQLDRFLSPSLHS